LLFKCDVDLLLDVLLLLCVGEFPVKLLGVFSLGVGVSASGDAIRALSDSIMYLLVEFLN
jgi:hypothetical protein